MPDTPAWRVTLSDLTCGEAERRALEAVLASGWLSMGPRVQAFEDSFSAQHGGIEAVAVSSGTAALHLALHALDIGPGDEVIQPAINFVAAANMTRAVGATPRFVDIVSPARPVMDPAAAAAAVSPRTRALIVLHYGGYPADIAALRDLAHRRGLLLIEDACHAPATTLDDRPLGTWGDAGCFSFFPNKNMTTGEGGMVVTPCSRVAQRCRQLRSHGMTTLTWERHRGHASSYDVVAPGFNYRIDELRAALGCAQLKRLQDFNRARVALTAAYRERLRDLPDTGVVFAEHEGPHAGHLFVVLVPEDRREAVLAHCRQRGVQTSLHYPCITKFSAYRSAAEVPHSRAFARQAVTLPLHPGLSTEDIDVVCAAVRAGMQEDLTVGC